MSNMSLNCLHSHPPTKYQYQKQSFYLPYTEKKEYEKGKEGSHYAVLAGGVRGCNKF